MSNFVKHSFNMFTQNASESACSSCAACDTTAADFNIVNFADTVLAVSVLLCSLIANIYLALKGLIDIIILAVIIIGIICLIKSEDKKRNSKVPARV